MLAEKSVSAEQIVNALDRSSRIVEWVQATINSAFWDIWEPLTMLIPETKGFHYDIIRASLLLSYASLVKPIRQHLLGKLNLS